MILASLIAVAQVASAQPVTPCAAQENFTLVMHGGTTRTGRTNDARLAFMKGLLTKAKNDLQLGAHGLDVVEEVVSQMEDSGLFNAGRASIANRDGFIETDASIMDGRNLDAGAVASMRHIKNPVRAARLVMEQTPHVMMVGDRGEAAVTGLGAETVTSDYFLRDQTKNTDKKHGTVGAAVLDRCGNLAAATSTGGYGAKIPGRVGDSPVIGAGVHAKNGVMAGSATGHGEYFIRHAAVKSIAARIEYGEESLTDAAQKIIDEMAANGGERGGKGGVVTVDAHGNIAMPFSTDGMVRGVVTHDTAAEVADF